MHRLNRTVAGLAAAAVLALTAACGPEDPATPTPSSSPSPSTSSSTPTQSPTKTETAEERDARMAEETIGSYWAMLDQLASDPKKSLSDLTTVARDDALEQWQQILTLRRGQEFTQVGSTTVDSPMAEGNGKGGWDAVACIDVSKVNLIDKAGKSVVKANRPSRVKYEFALVKDEGAFYVIRDKAVGVC